MKLKIGEFAKLAKVSTPTLRYYDEVGLLRPMQTDRFTSYRYYTLEQLLLLYRILALKDLGLSLEQIRELLRDELPVEQLRGMLKLKRIELQEQARNIQQRLERVETRLLQLETGAQNPSYDFVVKRIEAQRAAIQYSSIEHEEQITPVFNHLYAATIAFVVEHGGTISSIPFNIWYNEPDERVNNMRVAVVVPTESVLPENECVRIERLPEVAQMVSAIHQGPFSTLIYAYSAMLNWISGNGYQISGPNRELNLSYDPAGDPASYVTEIQYPVERL